MLRIPHNPEKPYKIFNFFTPSYYGLTILFGFLRFVFAIFSIGIRDNDLPMKSIFPYFSLLLMISSAKAAISVTSSTDFWNIIAYENPAAADPALDHQTGGVEGDIVGNATNASLYTQFDNGGTAGNPVDDEIAFRVRLAGDASPAGLKTVVWIGIDANSDGKIDLFAGALEDSKLGFYPAGTGANISPSTTSIDAGSPYYEVAVSTLNFNFSPVTATNSPGTTNFNLDNGSGGGANHTDHFVSWKLPFSALEAAVNGLNLPGVGTSFSDASGVRYIAATSNQANSLNQDLNGIVGGINSTSTWEQLGGMTPSYTSTGNLVPEPSIPTLTCLVGLLVSLRRRRPHSRD